MSEYPVIVTSMGYGKFGGPRRELLNRVVSADELALTLEEAAMIVWSDFQQSPTKRLTITVERI